MTLTSIYLKAALPCALALLLAGTTACQESSVAADSPVTGEQAAPGHQAIQAEGRKTERGNAELIRTLRGDDRRQSHGKMQAPVLIQWEHDAEIQTGQPARFRVTVVVLDDFENLRLRVTPPKGLQRAGGDFEGDFGFVSGGDRFALEFSVVPTRQDAFSIALHIAGERGTETIGIGRAIDFEVAGFDPAVRAAHEQSRDPGGARSEYTTLPGRTEFRSAAD